MKTAFFFVASVTLLVACGSKNNANNSATHTVQGRDSEAEANQKLKLQLDMKYGSSNLDQSVVVNKTYAMSEFFPQNWLIPNGKICLVKGTIRNSDISEIVQFVIVSNITLQAHDKKFAESCGKSAVRGGGFGAGEILLKKGLFAPIDITKTQGASRIIRDGDLIEDFTLYFDGVSRSAQASLGTYWGVQEEVTDLCTGVFNTNCDISLRADGVVTLRKL